MQKIDLKDKKLIVALARNSRESQTKLGKIVGLSKSAIGYRIEQLKKQGIIKRFMTVVNLTAAGYTTYNVFFKIHATKEKEDELFQYLNTHAFVQWCCRFLGEWDFHAEIAAKDIIHFNKIMIEITQTFADSLEDYRVHTALEIYCVNHIPKKFIQEAKLPVLEPVKRKQKQYEIDAIDRKLLYELNNDASAPLHVLAEKCNTSIDVVHYRMKKLAEHGIIIAYIPFIDIKKLGFTEYFCHLHLRNLTEEKASSLKQYFLQNPYIKYAFRGASQLEMLFLIAVQDTVELDTTIRELKSIFFENILDITPYLITEQGNYTLFPKGLLES